MGGEVGKALLSPRVDFSLIYLFPGAFPGLRHSPRRHGLACK